jgi:hypothetical protein
MPKLFSPVLLILFTLCLGDFIPVNAATAASAAPVLFSRLGGTFTDNFEVTLSAASSDAVIRYTLNGSVPTEASELYSNPIAVTTTVQIRARNFQSGLPASDTTSESYVKLDASLADFVSDLPLMVLDNFKRGTVPSTVAQPAFFAVFDRVNGVTSLRNPPQVTTRAGIRIRGSSTQDQAKHNFAVETWDEANQDKKIEPLGMPSESDWILYAPYNFDRANLRNPFIYELSNQVGRYAVRTRFVELFLNTTGGALTRNHYAGIYVFMEKIKQGPKRVAIKSLNPQDTTEPDISGGYMLKVDRLDPGDRGFTAAAQLLGFVEPKEREILTVQSNWIKGYIGEFGKALNSATFGNPGTGYARYIDTDAWIDHHLLNEFTKNPDGLVLSTYLFKDRVRKLAYGPIWDFDRTMGCDDDNRAANPIGWSGNFNYSWWGRLFADPNFQQKYVDRWTAFRRGPMSIANMLHIIDSMAAEIQQAEPRDAQKWKQVANIDGWRVKVDRFKTWVERRAAWIDSQWIPSPVPSHPGGVILPGLEVTLSGGETNTIFYTLDGSDPRLPGGAVSPTARIFHTGDAPIPVVHATQLTARAKNPRSKYPWSAPATAIFTEETLPQLVITEIMYDPLPPPISTGFDSSDYEFVEIQNLGSSPFNLAGCVLAGGIHFLFPNHELAPGRTVVVAGDLAAFSSRYGTDGLDALGDYTGRLNNGGDKIVLKDPAGRILTEFTYNSGGAWPKNADGKGSSLELKTVNGDFSAPSSWKASATVGGSPGASGFVRIEVAKSGDAPAVTKLGFHRQPGKSYVIQFREQPDSGLWRVLKTIPSASVEDEFQFSDSAENATRYYRLLIQ